MLSTQPHNGRVHQCRHPCYTRTHTRTLSLLPLGNLLLSLFFPPATFDPQRFNMTPSGLGLDVQLDTSPATLPYSRSFFGCYYSSVLGLLISLPLCCWKDVNRSWFEYPVRFLFLFICIVLGFLLFPCLSFSPSLYLSLKWRMCNFFQWVKRERKKKKWEDMF